MYEMRFDFRIIGSDRFQHADHGRKTHATRQQDHFAGWFLRQIEVSGGRGNLQDRADLDVIVQIARGAFAVFFPLDRYAIEVLVRAG